MLAAFDACSAPSGLRVFLTQDLERLPAYGPDVVAIVIGDEWSRVPRYVDRVAAVFKNHTVRPLLTSSFVREPSAANLLWYASYLRAWRHHAPGAVRWLALRHGRAQGARPAPIWLLPIGVLDQVELPMKALAERRHDVFFAGSVSNRAGGLQLRDRFAPKSLARHAMLASARELAAARRDIAVDLVTTHTFGDSLAAPARAYSERLMDARIALVPRGATAETFRFWQALRAGCVVITDTMPRHRWFYDGAPAVRVGRWSELGRVVPELLRDERRLAELHARGIDWWRTRASPPAVGRYMAQKVEAVRAHA